MKGKFIQNGLYVQEHEWQTIKVLLQSGMNVELIRASQNKGDRTPDIYINKVPWEIKAPIGKGKNTIKHNLQYAEKQSPNVIIDLIRCGLPEEQAISKIKYEFSKLKSIKQLKIITKSRKILDISRKR